MPQLTVRAIRCTAVEVPMKHVLGTSRAAIRAAPLMLVDLETEASVADNATTIAEAVAAAHGPVCLLSHSKGGLDSLEFLLQAKRKGKQIVGYGAPGKGNTLLNYCGIRTDFLDYTVDRNPYKHGKYTAGTHIPIFPPEKIQETKPDYVLILPWNLKEEIASQLSYIREWNGKCVVPIPDVEVL